MKALRWLGASLLSLVGVVLGLVGALLCVTVLLLPLGIPVLLLARRLFAAAAALVVPHGVRHPIEAVSASGSGAVDDAERTVRRGGKRLKRSAKKATKRAKRKI